MKTDNSFSHLVESAWQILPRLSIAIVAHDDNFGIGRLNVIPWKLPTDLAYFKVLTEGEAVIMGTKAWISLPPDSRPLKNRVNIVISRSLANVSGGTIAPDIQSGIELARNMNRRPIIIGGGQIYREAIEKGLVSAIYVTRIDGDFKCDTHIVDYSKNYKCIASTTPRTETGITFQFELWVKM